MEVKHKTLGILMLATIITHSCSLNDELELQLPSQSGQFIVEGYLMPGHPIEISLMESNSMKSVLANSPIQEAQVSISVNDSTYKLLGTYKWVEDRQLLVNYRTEKILNVLPNSKISMNIVTKNNDSISATTYSIDPAIIHHCKYNGNEILIGLTGKQFLRVSVCDFSPKSISKSFFINNSNTDENDKLREDIQINVPHEFQNSDSLDVRLFTISEDYYNYMKSVKNAGSAYFDSFIAPESIKSNIKGGIGILTYYTMEKRVLKISDN